MSKPRKQKHPNTYWNHGTKPIYISHTIKESPVGYPGEMEQKVIIWPGSGINLDGLELKNYPPEEDSK